VIGTGLIGGSIGIALRQRGWHVTGRDLDDGRAKRAMDLGALDAIGDDPGAAVVFVATPAGPAIGQAQAALAGGGVVTDVAGVKGPIVRAISNPRFVGGHPMAGSEQEGVEGADGSLFEGATWVLTPSGLTDPSAYARIQGVVSSFGADVVALPAERHDDLVALVSHVPHLTAATLMNLADTASEEHATLLRLAAGGFRDMTRVAAGHPGIWPDVLAANRDGIVETLDLLLAELARVRELVAAVDRDGLLEVLERARKARLNLPSRVARAEDVVEIRVPVPDQPGELAEVTTLFGEMGVNIFDIELAHSAEGERGVMVLVVDGSEAERARDALAAHGYRSAIRRVGP
jgi:prephenate dehydrogenase